MNKKILLLVALPIVTATWIRILRHSEGGWFITSLVVGIVIAGWSLISWMINRPREYHKVLTENEDYRILTVNIAMGVPHKGHERVFLSVIHDDPEGDRERLVYIDQPSHQPLRLEPGGFIYWKSDRGYEYVVRGKPQLVVYPSNSSRLPSLPLSRRGKPLFVGL